MGSQRAVSISKRRDTSRQGQSIHDVERKTSSKVRIMRVTEVMAKSETRCLFLGVNMTE